MGLPRQDHKVVEPADVDHDRLVRPGDELVNAIISAEHADRELANCQAYGSCEISHGTSVDGRAGPRLLTWAKRALAGFWAQRAPV